MTELQSGMALGRYELLVRVGRGGMAGVWVARERSAVSGKQRLVAVKAMLPELAQHSEFRSMFLGEVQIIQSIRHDNVVRVYEVSEDRGTLYMVMEWVEGDSLRNVIRAAKSRGALPPEIAVRIAADAAAGLHAAHELRDWDGELRGVVHCDVSPHNILVGIDGKAKLVDFGIANALGRLDTSSEGEKIKGKLSYMSPEQARGERLDRRTDVFALGIVLFEMTTGEQLFRGRDAAHTLELVKHGTIPRPTHLNPRYPEKLEAIALKALDRDPGRRYQTAQELEQALTSYLFEERILVSHGAVAQLLHRVMGPRIDKRREVIESVLQAVDGNLSTNQATSHSSLASLGDFAPMASDPFANTAVLTGDSDLGIAARLEAHTSLAVPLSTDSRPPAAPPERSSSAALWLGLLALLVAAAGAGLYVMQRQASLSSRSAGNNPGLSVPTSAGPSRTQSSAGSRVGDDAQSIDNLPMAADGTPLPAGAHHRANHKPGEPEVADNSSPSTPADAPKEQAKEPPKEEPKEPPKESDPPKPAEGLNRAAANSALASAAAAARACRSYGRSPTGSGRAAVTFSPEGSVVSVSVSQQFTGTAIGNCVLSHFRQARAPEFSGEATTLFYPFDIPE